MGRERGSSENWGYPHQTIDHSVRFERGKKNHSTPLAADNTERLPWPKVDRNPLGSDLDKNHDKEIANLHPRYLKTPQPTSVEVWTIVKASGCPKVPQQPSFKGRRYFDC